MMDGLFERIKESVKICEASIRDLKRKQRTISWLYPTFQDRVNKIGDMGGLRLTNTDDDNWDFKVHSGTKKDTWYDCVIHFVNVKDTLKKLVMNRRLWTINKERVDLRKLASEFVETVNVQTFCSCPSDLYSGFHYIRGLPRYDAKYTNPEHRPPKKRNPRQYGAYCFDDRAMVLMSDGTFKSIKNVNVGDSVFTHTGEIHQVTNKFQREADTINVSIQGVLGEFGVTPNHKFYVRGRNDKCLCGCGKDLSFSKFTINHCGVKHLYTRKFTSGHFRRGQVLEDKSTGLVWSEVNSLDKYSMLHCPSITAGDTVQFDPDLARLIGYYVAEGSYLCGSVKHESDTTFINSNGKLVGGVGVMFTISNEEIDTIGKDIINILRNKFGIEVKVNKINHARNDGGNSKYTQVLARSKDLFKLVFELVGFPKRINNKVFSWNKNARIEFITGWFLGDGNFNKQGNSCVFVSSSDVLSQQLFTVITSLGIRADIKKYKSTNIVGTRNYVTIRVNDVPLSFTNTCKSLGKRNCGIVDTKRAFQVYRTCGETYTDGGMFRFFRKVNKSELSKSVVYNLEVEGDNSYIVNGVAVHNCKHTQAIMKALPFYNTAIAKWLNQFYNKEIAEYQELAKKELGIAKAGAKELTKRMESEKKPMERPDRRPERPSSGIRRGKTHLEDEKPTETTEDLRDTLRKVWGSFNK